MQFGRVGGWLIVCGGIAVIVVVAKYLNGDGLGFGSWDAGGLLVDAALGLLAAGAIVLCAGGPEPLNTRLVRAGLGILAVGQLSLLGVSIAFAASTSDDLANIRTFIPLYLVGGGAGELGLLLAGLGLVRRPDAARAVGALLVAGFLLVGAALGVAASARLALPAHTALWAIAVAIAGDIGIGVLAIAVRRPAAVGTASG
jgi:hypothetical protein